MSERIIQNNAYKDQGEREKVRVYTKKLSTLKVENMEIDSKLSTCIKVSTENLFRGNIFEFPLIDVIINDDFIEIRGLIIGKLYSGLILNLEYTTGNRLYILEDFTVEAGDVISEFICKTYKIAFKRDVEEEEFNEWYFKLQRSSNEVGIFTNSIVSSEEFMEVNKKLDDFIDSSYKVIFRRSISEGAFNYWKDKYIDGILKDSDDTVRKYIIDQMTYYKHFQYSITEE